jgi:hypothetical protein
LGCRLSLDSLALVVAGRPGDAALAAGGGGEGAVGTTAGGRPRCSAAASIAAAAPVCGLRRSTVTACCWPPISRVKYLGVRLTTRYGLLYGGASGPGCLLFLTYTRCPLATAARAGALRWPCPSHRRAAPCRRRSTSAGWRPASWRRNPVAAMPPSPTSAVAGLPPHGQRTRPPSAKAWRPAGGRLSWLPS